MLRELYYIPQWQGSCSELTAAAHPRNVHLGDKWFPGSPPLGTSCLCCLVLYRGADKSFARPGRKQANVSVRITWISFGAFLCRKKLDDSSRLDVVEIASVPDMLQSFFPYWLGEGLISTLVKQTFGDLVVVLLKMWRCGARVVPDVVKVKGRSDFIIRVLNC